MAKIKGLSRYPTRALSVGMALTSSYNRTAYTNEGARTSLSLRRTLDCWGHAPGDLAIDR